MKRKLGFVVTAGLVGGLAWWYFGGDVRRQEDASLLFDRAWVDALPGKDKKAFMNAFVVAKRLPYGVFQKASRYRLEVERFGYKTVKAGELQLTFPQTEKSGALRYTISSCSELKGFDLCLSIAANPWGGPRRYYGKRAKRRDRTHQALELLTARDEQ